MSDNGSVKKLGGGRLKRRVSSDISLSSEPKDLDDLKLFSSDEEKYKVNLNLNQKTKKLRVKKVRKASTGLELQENEDQSTEPKKKIRTKNPQEKKKREKKKPNVPTNDEIFDKFENNPIYATEEPESRPR